MKQCYKLIDNLTAFDITRKAMRDLDLKTHKVWGRLRTDLSHKTGLSAPHPETLKVVNFDLISRRYPSIDAFDMALTDEQIATCLVPLITPRAEQVFEVIQDTSGNSNSYNSPSRVELPKGTRLLIKSNEGTNRGDHFNEIVGTGKKVSVFEGRSFHPYDVIHLDPRFFKLVA